MAFPNQTSLNAVEFTVYATGISLIQVTTVGVELIVLVHPQAAAATFKGESALSVKAEDSSTWVGANLMYG